MYEIKDVKEEELELISKLEKDLFLKNAWSFEQIRNEFKNKFSKILVIKKNNKILGYLIFRKILDEIEILRIGIIKEYQNKKIGTYFLQKFIETFCYNKNINKIFLEVSVSNKIAYNLYKKLGFKDLSIRKNYYNDYIFNSKEDAILMVKEFNN